MSPGRRPGPRPAWGTDAGRLSWFAPYAVRVGVTGRRRRRWRRRCRRPGGRRPGRGVRHRTWRPRHGRGRGRWRRSALASEGRLVVASWRWVRATPGFFSWSSTSRRLRSTSCGGAGAGLGGGLPGGGGQHLRVGGRRRPRDAGDREGPGQHEDDGKDEGESSADAAGCGVHGRDGSEE